MNQTSRRLVRIFRLQIFIFGFVGRTGGAKPTLVVPPIERLTAFGSLRFRDAGPELADPFVMKRLAGAHQDIVATVLGVETKRGRHLFEVVDYIVSLLLWRAVISLRRALNIYSVLVSSGEKEGLDSLLSFAARDRVGHNHGIEVADMRQAVGVIDRC